MRWLSVGACPGESCSIKGKGGSRESTAQSLPTIPGRVLYKDNYSNRQYDAANETIDVIPGSQDDAATGTKCRVVALQLSGVPSGMSRIHRECPESDPSDRSVVADVPMFLRQERFLMQAHHD